MGAGVSTKTYLRNTYTLLIYDSLLKSKSFVVSIINDDKSTKLWGALFPGTKDKRVGVLVAPAAVGNAGALFLVALHSWVPSSWNNLFKYHLEFYFNMDEYLSEFSDISF